MVPPIAQFEVEIKGADGHPQRSTLAVYIEGEGEVIAAIQVDGWELGRGLTETRGAWRPEYEIWRVIGEEDWRTDPFEGKPPRALCRRAKIEDHRKLIGDAMQAEGLPRPYSARGGRRKVDTSELARRHALGQTDDEVAAALGVKTHTITKRRWLDKEHSRGRQPWRQSEARELPRTQHETEIQRKMIEGDRALRARTKRRES